MVVTVASFKGGVAKTTTAIHLAGVLNESAPTLLIDSDYNESATQWAAPGQLPFTVVRDSEARTYIPQYRENGHIVIDTPARASTEDLRALAERGDLIVIPATPDALGLQALMRTVRIFKELGFERFQVLLTIVPPYPSRDGEEAREALERGGLRVMKTMIPRAVAFQKAALAGQLVKDVLDPRAQLGWAAYQDVGRTVLTSAR